MADTPEKFSLKKFIGSFTQLVPWIKTLRYGLGIAAIVAVALLVLLAWNHFFKKKPGQVQNQQTGVVVHAGANLYNCTLAGQSQEQKPEQKKLQFFVEPYGEVSSNRKAGVGIKTGVTYYP